MKIVAFIALGVFCISAFLTIASYLTMWFMEWLFYKIFYEEEDE